jgi:putative transposase
MQFVEGSIYHIYNRGNNKQVIFFKDDNYAYFRQKMLKYVYPNADILAWCLMPNHFHFLVHANQNTSRLVKHSPIEINALTEGIRLLLSSYTKGIQKQENITGNLFQQKTKSKCVDDYAFTAFHYIHQNAYRAKLTDKLETYRHCSINDYLLAERESMCNRIKAMELLGINTDSFLRDSYALIDDEKLKEIW